MKAAMASLTEVQGVYEIVHCTAFGPCSTRHLTPTRAWATVWVQPYLACLSYLVSSAAASRGRLLPAAGVLVILRTPHRGSRRFQQQQQPLHGMLYLVITLNLLCATAWLGCISPNSATWQHALGRTGKTWSQLTSQIRCMRLLCNAVHQRVAPENLAATKTLLAALPRLHTDLVSCHS